MKNNLLLFLLWVSLSCENKTDTGTTAQMAPTANPSVEKSVASAVATEDNEGVEPVGQEQALQIQIGQVGSIRKGMAAHELYMLYDSTQVQKKKGKPNGYIYSIYQNAGNPAIICTTSGSEVISEIAIHDTAYKTAKGIGVGSTFAELTAAYHVAKVQADQHYQIYVQVEELQRKQFSQNTEEMIGVLFEIGFDASDLIEPNGTVSPASIPPDAKIVSILL